MKHIEYGYELCAGRPLEGRALAELQAFLAERGLTYAPGIDHSAVIRDGAGRIAAAASLDRNIVKCAAVRPDLQGTGLMASLITHLRQESVSRGGDSLFLYGAGGELLFSRRPLGDLELVLEDSRNNRLNWRVLYSLDQRAIRLEFIEEQRYMILAAVAMLLIIVQASVFIAYNISAPLRQLSKVCTLVSRDPGGSEDLSVEYIRRRDETGQLAAAFQAMLDSQRRYTRELTQVKMLNETIVANLPLGVVVRDGHFKKYSGGRHAPSERGAGQAGEEPGDAAGRAGAAGPGPALRGAAVRSIGQGERL